MRPFWKPMFMKKEIDYKALCEEMVLALRKIEDPKAVAVLETYRKALEGDNGSTENEMPSLR